MKNILVPTDFSLNANKALDFAVQIAREAKAEINLIHACDMIDTIFKDNQSMYKEYNQTICDKANEELSILKESIEETEKISIQKRVYNGNVTDSILKASEELHADLVIMGTLGKTRLQEKIFGSITAGIMAKTNIPVLAVPLLSEWNIPKKILLMVNHSEEQPDVVMTVFELAALFNATVHVAIFTDMDSSEAIDYLKDKRDITSYEQKLRIKYKNADISSVHIDGHRFRETIEQYILEQGMDIVAMITHKRTFLESIFNRSMTNKMSYHTRIPLLAIPA